MGLMCFDEIFNDGFDEKIQSWVGLQFVIVVFPDHTHLLFDVFDRRFNDGFDKRFDDELDVL